MLRNSTERQDGISVQKRSRIFGVVDMKSQGFKVGLLSGLPVFPRFRDRWSELVDKVQRWSGVVRNLT